MRSPTATAPGPPPSTSTASTATGAQHLAHACLRYDPTSATFTYPWHLNARAHGGETLELRLTYPAPAITWTHITIAPACAGLRPGHQVCRYHSHAGL